MSEQHRRAAQARWSPAGRGQPYTGDFLSFMDLAGLSGESWAAWRVFWKVVDALPLNETELAVFRAHTGRTTPPAKPVRECAIICGRRSGKSRSMAARAVWTGIRRLWRELLATGERATIPLIAADRKQASVAFGYVTGLLALPALAPYVTKETRETVELSVGATLEVHTCSFKSVRGFTCPLVLGDETAFWQTDDGSASPDAEVIYALKPTMATIPDALLMVGSTPYARVGALWRMFDRHYGRDASDTIVWVSDTRSMHPGIDQAVIDELFAEDPARALAEYGQDGRVQFRADIESFLSREAVEAVTVPGRRELGPTTGVSYAGFVDVSGGSQDSYTLGIAHAADGGVVVLDALRETRPPFSPEQVTADYAALLRAYHLAEVTGDKYGGEFPRELFAKVGIEYRPAERTKSDLYRELLPVINARRCDLLDDPRLKAQLVSLERRVARGGKDSIDHPPGGRDDLANAAAGCVVLAGGFGAPWERWIQAAKEGVLTGAVSPAPSGAAPQRAATRRIVRPADRVPTQQRCACGCVFGIGDTLTSCPNCGRSLPFGADPPARQLPPLVGPT